VTAVTCGHKGKDMISLRRLSSNELDYHQLIFFPDRAISFSVVKNKKAVDGCDLQVHNQDHF